ncbi:juvenile hormone esterase-like isoform X2 [Daktulosphaira vitifoliae]|uniref:juvenile hormone esterase-like isoform X2 n=1 Tax=Daktulosphaira vitifoliae TaxID=58002 RepID=UPI0021A97A27|nr:juvenile hormone esterase-like isoform X2 [Daktulosphaira vitifoliae]
MYLIQVGLLSVIFIELILCFGLLEVTTKKGILKGHQLLSRNGRVYNSFTGIPYAEPPIGELRFEAPKEVKPWKEILDATKEPNACIQKGDLNSSEDCLYLNVYKPQVDKLLPVMFWIHGGAFSSGNGGSQMFGPQYFMDKDVIIVSINYRLGVLGFMSTEDEVIPGNLGLKDQVLALRWVQENIELFGGNPNQVTVFGASSGAASVGYHLLSPLSKDLFHGAILQSGTPLNRWAIEMPGIARKRANIIFKKANCIDKNPKSLLKCLRKLPAKFFTNIASEFSEFLHYPIAFKPVVEKNCNINKNAFLCRHQFNDFYQESFVPVIIGINSAEGAMITSYLYNETSVLYPEFLQDDFKNTISIILSYNKYALPENVNDIGQRLLKKYYPREKMEDHTHFNTAEMMTDGAHLHGALSMAYSLLSPVYFYIYDYQNEFSFNKLFGPCKKYLGVTHGDELNSLFKLNAFNLKTLNDQDTKISKVMVNIWTQFASTLRRGGFQEDYWRPSRRLKNWDVPVVLFGTLYRGFWLLRLQ